MNTKTRSGQGKTNERAGTPAITLLAGTVAVLLLSGCLFGGDDETPFHAASVLDDDEIPDPLHACESEEVDTDDPASEEEAEEMWADRPEPSYFGYQTLAPSPQETCESSDFYLVLMEMRFDSREDYEEWRACIQDTWDGTEEDELDECSYTYGLWGNERIFLVFATPSDPENPDGGDQGEMQQATDAAADALMAKYPGLESNLDEMPQW